MARAVNEPWTFREHMRIPLWQSGISLPVGFGLYFGMKALGFSPTVGGVVACISVFVTQYVVREVLGRRLTRASNKRSAARSKRKNAPYPMADKRRLDDE